MNRIIFIVIFALLGITLLIPAARAVQLPLFQLGGEETKKSLGEKPQNVSLTDCIAGNEAKGIAAGSCGVEHIFLLANNIIRWVAGVSGAVALFMYVMGGLWMIFSGGSSSRIERGKDILIGTTLALVFILTSWLIVSFVLQSLGTTSDYTLTATTCGSNTDCIGGKVCYEKKCVEPCYAQKTVNETDPNRQWACKTPASCGSGMSLSPITSVAGCGGAPNCAPGLCTDSTLVCCY